MRAPFRSTAVDDFSAAFVRISPKYEHKLLVVESSNRRPLTRSALRQSNSNQGQDEKLPLSATPIDP